MKKRYSKAAISIIIWGMLEVTEILPKYNPEGPVTRAAIVGGKL